MMRGDGPGTARQMRIAHTDSSMELGGRELAVLAITKGLMTAGHSVVLVVPPGSQLAEAAERRGIPRETIPMSRPRSVFAVRALLGLLARHRIELVHTHSSRDQWVAAVASRLSARRPRLVLGRHHSSPISGSLLNRLLYRRLAHCIVTTGGERLRRQVQQEMDLDASRVVSIPTGVDLERFAPEVDGGPVRDEWKIALDAVLVGTVCFLRDYKGLGHFIEAARLVVQRAPRVRFVIVGDGPERAAVLGQIERAGLAEDVLMPGHREDVHAVMAAIDVFVMASVRGETLTQTIPQALAMKRPVVATDVGGISDIVRHGSSGLLVPPRDPRALADGILWLIANRNAGRRFGAVGRRLVVDAYSSASALARTEQLYRRLLDGGQAP